MELVMPIGHTCDKTRVRWHAFEGGTHMPAAVRRMWRRALALVAAGEIVGTLVMSSAGTAVAN